MSIVVKILEGKSLKVELILLILPRIPKMFGSSSLLCRMFYTRLASRQASLKAEERQDSTKVEYS